MRNNIIWTWRRTAVIGVVCATAYFLLQAAPAFAQHTPKHPATLTGVVLGPDDRPVANAAVSYQSSGGNAPHATHTDTHGRFTITKLRADNYDVRASAKGIFSEWEKNVTLKAGETRSITLRLIYSKEMPKPTKP